MKHLKSYKLFESISQINWDLIDDARYIALEYVDEYCVFNYFIMSLDGEKVFYGGELTQNGKRDLSYAKYNGEPIKYKIMIFSKPYDVNLGTTTHPNIVKFNDDLEKETKDVVSRLKSIYPDEIIVGVDNLKENFTYKDINYKYEWALPTSPIRKKVQQELDDILLEAKDLGYGISTSWLGTPYAWIGVKLINKLKFSPTIKSFNNNELSDTIDRVKEYLISEGFQIREYKMNSQIYIYFNYETP